MARSRRDREVNIFNFSFLDLLACTVGALTFILIMVVVVNVGSLPADLVARLEVVSEQAEHEARESRVCRDQLEEFSTCQDELLVIQEQGQEVGGQLDTCLQDSARTTAELDVCKEMSEGRSADPNLERQIGELAQGKAREEARARELADKLAETERQLQGLRAREGAPSAREDTANWWSMAPLWFKLIVLAVLLFGGLFIYAMGRHVVWQAQHPNEEMVTFVRKKA